ncbi:MAG TPA: hypothetical protein VMC42_08270 [Methanoregulaceae archaeon]|nr:hypothetical protein [Methanoregulaceae archaeon]
MSEYAEGTVGEQESFWGNLPDVGGYLSNKLPTMDKSLDTYFDKNMEAIIEEWGLLVENDLLNLERKVNKVTEQVNQLYKQKTILSDRAAKLDTLISKLEGH